jgi:endonuclease V-like protein UPF0215 family
VKPAKLSHVIGFDDAPFPRSHRGDVLVVGAVFARDRLDGILSTRVRRDGTNATRKLADAVLRSRFHAQCHALLLQGIAFAGFNVVDIHRLSGQTGLAVVVVSRRKPDLDSIHRALLSHVPGATHKWKLIEQAGPMQRVARVWIQCAGIDADRARKLIEQHCRHGDLPEPLRTAHLVAGGVVTGESTGRP